jgi:predicted alpha/beta-hydrolase family hydrolase
MDAIIPRMPANERRLEVEAGDGMVSAAWRDASDAFAVMVVGHGAGSGMESPFLVGFARGAAQLGLATLRFMFPYMQRPGRRPPDRPAVLLAAMRGAFDEAQRLAGGRPVLAGGKSLGGRVASLAAADGMPAAGLIFLGYPLHPPGRPEKLRDAHLDAVQPPMLFLQGSRDPFATPELLEAVVKRLGSRAQLLWIEGGDHSFKVAGERVDGATVGARLAGPAARFAQRVAGSAV